MARTPTNSRNPLAIFAIVAVIAIAGVAAFIALTGADDEITERPTGAGTVPDGAVDEFQEGLRNETATDDFIDQSATGDAGSVPPLLETEGNGPDPVTSAEDLDAAGGEEPILDRIGASD
jgi:hypothetical protein